MGEPIAGEAGRHASGVSPDYRLLVEALPLIAYVDALDEVSSAMYMSPQVERILGYAVHEWLADAELFAKVLHPDDRERVLAEVRRSNETRELFDCEYRLIARDGRIVWFHDRAVAVLNASGPTGYSVGYMLDVTHMKQAEEQRRALVAEVERRAHAAAVLSHVADGVFQVDEEGQIRIWNRAAELLTRPAEADALGRRISDVLSGWDSVAPKVDLAATPGEPRRSAVVPFLIADEERWFAISGVEFEGGVVYAFRDLTHERSLEDTRRDLVATASHELRTPLASVYGAAQTLLHRRVDDEQRARLLRMIATECERLTRILDEILVAARLDAGGVALSLAPCDATEIVRNVVEAFRGRCEDRPVTLAIEEGLPPVTADADLLQRILLNLLDNALKYTRGPISVNAAAREDEVRFDVSDEGPGIPFGERQRIFEKFYRLDPELRDGVGGTGLGLFIARELVAQMRGRIWLDPNDRGGSTFSIALPTAH